MKAFFTILVLLAITTFPSCYPYPRNPTNLTDLPAFTTSGRNTFGCIINGETFYNMYEEDISAWYNGQLNVSAQLPSMYLNIMIPVYDRKTFNLVIDESDTVNTASISYNNFSCEHEFGKGHAGNILNLHVRRFDRNIVAGTFSLTATDECGKINLTQGRFDVSLR